jgi:peptidoglycan/xylan/chitin deacetylase (PgdA/CDA1 family)
MTSCPLYGCFTMDCEQVGANQGGPASWELGEHAIRGYCETLLSHQLTATLFVVPQVATRYRPLLQQLAGQGIEVGLHFHPQDHGYPDFLGAFTGEEQAEMLRPAIEAWSQAMGRAPRVFRPGNFSANDATFPTLAGLGFLAGSVSCPLRNFVEARANWGGAPLDPHFTHAANRLLSGNLPFFEVPITVDPESIMWGGRTPLELRLEMVDGRAHGYTIRKSIARQQPPCENRACPELAEGGLPQTGQRRAEVPGNCTGVVVTVLTHNIFDYSDPREFRRQVLDEVVAEMRRAAEAGVLELLPATLLGLRQTYLEAAS